jgi:hypothetical protein
LTWVLTPCSTIQNSPNSPVRWSGTKPSHSEASWRNVGGTLSNTESRLKADSWGVLEIQYLRESSKAQRRRAREVWLRRFNSVRSAEEVSSIAVKNARSWSLALSPDPERSIRSFAMRFEPRSTVKSSFKLRQRALLMRQREMGFSLFKLRSTGEADSKVGPTIAGRYQKSRSGFQIDRLVTGLLFISIHSDQAGKTKREDLAQSPNFRILITLSSLSSSNLCV